MSNDDIFDKERDILQRAEKGELSVEQLTRAYKKLLKQSQRLVRVSDRQQLELIELNELKNKFVGMAAHDMRNPAGVINGFSGLMLDDPDMDEAERAEFIEIINQASGAMLRLLNDLLDVSAIESGKLTLKTSAGRLDELVEERVRLLRSIAENKSIHLKVDGAPCTALIDEDRMGQVIDNLISNAIKFSQSETEIAITVKPEDGKALMSIADQGQGIPEDEVDKIFGTFQKLSVQPTGGEKSHGLGLAIVKKIVSAHGGHIGLQSKVGQGTTFRVTLP